MGLTVLSRLCADRCFIFVSVMLLLGEQNVWSCTEVRFLYVSVSTPRCWRDILKKRVGVVLGRGGHTAQTFALVDLLGRSFEYIYMVGVLDPLTRAKIRIPGRVLPVLPPRLQPTDSRLLSVLRTLVTLLLAFLYLAFWRPGIVVSCGTGLTVPVFYAARALGVRTVYIESMSRVETLSMTGRLLLGKTDLFIVQWPQLAERTPGAVYGGQLL